MAIMRTLLLVQAITPETMPMQKQRGDSQSRSSGDPGCDGEESDAPWDNLSDESTWLYQNSCAAATGNRSDTPEAPAQATISINEAYDEGFRNGWHQGKGCCKGWEKGKGEGWNAGKEKGNGEGWNAGKAKGWSQGRNTGFNEGRVDGCLKGKHKGYALGMRAHGGNGARSADDRATDASDDAVESAGKQGVGKGTAPKSGARAVPLTPRKNVTAPVRPNAGAVTPKFKAKAPALPSEAAASVGLKKSPPDISIMPDIGAKMTQQQIVLVVAHPQILPNR